MDYTELEVEKILWHTLCEILGTPLAINIGNHIVVIESTAKYPLGQGSP